VYGDRCYGCVKEVGKMENEFLTEINCVKK